MPTGNRRNGLLALAAAVLLAGVACVPATAADKPNVLLIMTDDLGWGDLGCYGATRIKTPNLDRLAAGGLRFTSGYASASTCTPTRYSLLTGEYAWRRRGTGIAAPNATALIQPGRVTLPSVMKAAGYATGVVGKWHLGLGKPPKPDWSGEIKPGPLEIGFDSCFLMPTTGDRVPCVYVEGHRIVGLDPRDPVDVFMRNPDGQPTGITHRHTLKMDWSHGHNHSIVNGISRIGFMVGGQAARWTDEDMADVFTRKALAFIDGHKDEPFFLFFSTHDIHVPRMPHKRFQGASPTGYRGDAVQQMDWCVGQLLERLDQHKLTEKTLVVFCSDNGPVLDDGYKDGAVTKLGDHKPAGPYRGGKYTIYEGGTRTPFITRWPGRIRPGVSDEIVCTIDLLASLARMTGQSLPKDAAPDSFDVLPALLGEKGATGRGHLVEQGRGLALRVGNWKLLEHPSRRPSKKKNAQPRDSKIELFDLAADPGETKNVAAAQPDKVAELQAMLEKLKKDGRSRPVE